MTLIDGPRRSDRPLVAASRQRPDDPATAPDHDEPRRHRRRTTTSAAQAIATSLLALALAVLLCADTLVQVAERQPFGTTRDIALAVSEPIRTVSHAVGLDRPRQWLADLTGNDASPTSAAGRDLDVPSATIPPDIAKPDKPSTSPGSSTTQPPVATPTTLAPRRTPTAEAPLRVAMFGDSLMGQLSMGFGRLVRDDPRIRVDSEYHVSTGLARPDVLDWPFYLSLQIPPLDPEVVYLAFGGNDDQDMQRADGTRVSILTPEWREEYAVRVALAMDVAAQGDRTVVWIGLPAERPERLNQVKDVMNEVAREQAALRPRVVYVDLVSLLTPDGQYADDFVAADGSAGRIRERDGVHLNAAGGNLVAPTLLAVIATDWNLVAPTPAPTVPPTTTTTTTTTTAPPAPSDPPPSPPTTGPAVS